MKAIKKKIEVTVWKLPEYNNPEYTRFTVSRMFLDALMSGNVYFDNDIDMWTIETIEGAVYTEPGNYLVRGAKGEYWPIRADIFEETYDVIGYE